jgi:hypothetical protein
MPDDPAYWVHSATSRGESMIDRQSLKDPIELVAFVGATATLSANGKLTASEQRKVKSALDALMQICATYIWLVDSDEDKNRARLLKSLFVGLASINLLIGCLAFPKSIVLKQFSSTKIATEARLARSRIIDDLIATLAWPLWQKHSRRSAHWIAQQTITALNAEFGKIGLPAMKIDAIRKRLEKSRLKILGAS